LAVDKNPNDPTAHEKFQAIGEAYQVLSNDQLRAAYDKYGKDQARPQEGFVDPAEFFTSIFGGDAFVDWIGEISLMKDLTTTMEITMANEDLEDDEAEFPGTEEAKKESMKDAVKEETAQSSAAPPPKVVVEEEKGDDKTSATAVPETPASRSTTPTPSASGTSTPKRTAIPIRPALMDRAEGDVSMEEKEAELRKKEKKKGGLSKEQREQLAAYDKERARVRAERIDTLAKKLVDRISVWTETDKGSDVTVAFQQKTRLEVENLKMESFGIDILHAIGQTYMSKATALLKSQKFLGIGGFFSRVRDKGTLVKETWNTISSAIDAQQTMEEMARMEEKGGDDWTEEKKVEYERRVTGKILTAAWRGSKFEIQSVLREVCDNVLNDKKVPLGKRLERAEALVLIGDIFLKVGQPFALLHTRSREWLLTCHAGATNR
jgi:curved DNA-binding protein CbpA